MKRYLTFFFLLITSIALCAYPEGAINNIDGSALGWDEANQVWRPIAVDATGKLSSGSSPAVASISIDTSSIDSALNIEDKSVAELVNGIGTETANMEAILRKLLPPQIMSSTRSTYQPNTAYQITPIVISDTYTNRVYVELRAIDPDAEFYIGLGNSVTDSTGRPVKGRILINIGKNQDIYVYHTNASAIEIQHTEGWN